MTHPRLRNFLGGGRRGRWELGALRCRWSSGACACLVLVALVQMPPLLLPLCGVQLHVLVLERRLQHRGEQAAASAAGHVLRQLRIDGEFMWLMFSVMRVTLAHAPAVIRVCADCSVLRERCCQWHHVPAVVAHAGAAGRVVAVRMVHSPHVLRQLCWGSGVGGVDAGSCLAVYCL